MRAQGASIVSTAAEGAAFLLGQSKDQRLEISRPLRKFYGMRSSVAHSGRSSFSEIDPGKLQPACSKGHAEGLRRADVLCAQDDLDKEVQLVKYFWVIDDIRFHSRCLSLSIVMFPCNVQIQGVGRDWPVDQCGTARL
jgi:hypothetical protein